MITSASKGKSNANSHVCYKVLFEHIKTTRNKFTSPKISIQYVTCFFCELPIFIYKNTYMSKIIYMMSV